MAATFQISEHPRKAAKGTLDEPDVFLSTVAMEVLSMQNHSPRIMSACKCAHWRTERILGNVHEFLNSAEFQERDARILRLHHENTEDRGIGVVFVDILRDNEL